MSKEKINHYINIDKLGLAILKEDASGLRNIVTIDEETPDYVTTDIEDILRAKDLTSVVNKLGDLHDKLAKDQHYNLAIVINAFLQRYTYYLATERDYDADAGSFSASLLKDNDITTVFAKVFVPFFSRQLDFYAGNFIDKLNEFGVSNWNEEFDKKLRDDTSAIINETDFFKKLDLASKFLSNYSKLDEIMTDLKVDPEKPDAEKETFMTFLQEFRIVIEALSKLVVNIVIELKKVMKVD